jgi:hypothetical protein
MLPVTNLDAYGNQIIVNFADKLVSINLVQKH